jgi:16S rRNA (guanine527-N7)-methyltransferase
MDHLIQGALELGVQLDPAQLERFGRLELELLDWNRRFNLTAITDPLEVQVKHFVDALTVIQTLDAIMRDSSSTRVLDIGAGAGFPGLPIAIARPSFHVTLNDATAKKCRYLQHVVDALGLGNVEVICGRAEELARESDLRARFDVVLARAVAALATLVELALPFARVGGRLIAMKKSGINAELRDASYAIRLLGGKLLPPVEVRVPLLNETRQLVSVEKVRPTPSEYPRRPGVPAHAPLVARTR